MLGVAPSLSDSHNLSVSTSNLVRSDACSSESPADSLAHTRSCGFTKAGMLRGMVREHYSMETAPSSVATRGRGETPTFIAGLAVQWVGVCDGVQLGG